MTQAVQSRVFVVGCPRSGTTLLQSLLAGHSNVCSFTESHFFDDGFARNVLGGYRPTGHLAALFERWAAENAVDDSEFAKNLTLGPYDPMSIGREIVALFDRVSHSRGKQLWVEKTPDHVLRIPLIENVAPAAKFVHIIRNGPDVVTSLRKAGGQWGTQRSWGRCAAHWVAALRATKKWAGRSNHYVVVYERLVAAPDAEMRTLCSWLGLPWERGMIERSATAAAPVIASGESWKANNFGGIQSRPTLSMSGVPRSARVILRLTRAYEHLTRGNSC